MGIVGNLGMMLLVGTVSWPPGVKTIFPIPRFTTRVHNWIVTKQGVLSSSAISGLSDNLRCTVCCFGEIAVPCPILILADSFTAGFGWFSGRPQYLINGFSYAPALRPSEGYLMMGMIARF